MKPKEFAQRLGDTFAVLQHGADLGAEWVLKKVAKLQEEQRREEQELKTQIAQAKGESPVTEGEAEEPSVMGKVLSGASTFFRMLTEVGESYYKRYGEIKKNTSDK